MQPDAHVGLNGSGIFVRLLLSSVLGNVSKESKAGERRDECFKVLFGDINKFNLTETFFDFTATDQVC